MHPPLNVILKTLTGNACFCEQTKLIELKEYTLMYTTFYSNGKEFSVLERSKLSKRTRTSCLF